jgi:hypothetical protein
MVLGDRAYYSAVDRGDRLRRPLDCDEGDLLDMSTNAYVLFGIPLTAGFQLFVCKRPIKNPMTRLRLLAPILVVVFPAGCGGERKSLRLRPRRRRQTRIRRRLPKRRPGTKGNQRCTEPT